MALHLIVPVLTVTGIGLALNYGSKAVVRIVAGIAAIAARDPQQSRAERALAVLRELRNPDARSPE